MVLIGNAVHAVAHPWFAHAEYGRLAPEPYGLTKAQRSRLADVALDSIVPFGGGDRVLREARLPGGSQAFDPKERRHLRSVRGYVLGLYLINALGIVALAGLVVVRRARPVVRDGVFAGSVLTLAIAAFVGVYVAVAPVSFLGGFHRVFFSGSSWRFADTETLRRLFPDAFWSDTAIAIGVLVAIQAAALLVAMQAIRHRPRRAAHAGRP